MPRILKRELPSLLLRIKELKAKGLNIPQIAIEVRKSRASIATLVQRHGITGWPTGAAARDQTGINNPNYKNGLSRATISRLTKQVLLQDGRNLFTCERCGRRAKVEHPRHHIDRNRANNEPHNLLVLCVSCHNVEHMPERKRDALGKLLQK
jgi:DNA-directed RNA polymerase subunit M/transcription elongation factor TFIIS